MNRAQIPRRRTRAFRRFVGETRQKIKKHQIISGFIGWMIASVLDGIAESLVDLNDWLGKPLEWVGKWHPTNRFLDWMVFSLLLFLYLGAISLAWRIIRKVLGHEQIGLIYPKILYEDELAAATHAIDYADEVGEELVRERVEDLMFSIAETVAAAIGVPPKYYRAYFVVGSDDGTAISGFRLGRQFRVAEKNQQSIDQILLADADPMARMYQRTKTVSVMREVQEEFPESNIHQMVMVRNPGKFRMCFLMAVLDPNAEIDEHDVTFLQVSYIIRTLGFMDKLVGYVLQYD